MDVDNSRRIVDILQNGEVTEVEGASYSFSEVKGWLAEQSLKELNSVK